MKPVIFTCVAAAAASASAGIVEIGPFLGDQSDGFGSGVPGGASQVLPVFDGASTLSNLTPSGAIKHELSSQFGGDLVTPIAGLMVGQLGIGRWDFAAPVVEFGGYFENNSGADDATLFFYDENLALIGSVVADIPAAAGDWTWNGWRSDTPFSRIEVVGNGVVNGFIWYENVQLTTVPAPGGGVACLVALAGASRRRR